MIFRRVKSLDSLDLDDSESLPRGLRLAHNEIMSCEPSDHTQGARTRRGVRPLAGKERGLGRLQVDAAFDRSHRRRIHGGDVPQVRGGGARAAGGGRRRCGGRQEAPDGAPARGRGLPGQDLGPVAALLGQGGNGLEELHLLPVLLLRRASGTPGRRENLSAGGSRVFSE